MSSPARPPASTVTTPTAAAAPSASPASTVSPGSLVLSARPRPFELARVHREVPAGSTLAEMVDATIEPAFRPIARVRIAGHPVPRELWARVRPKAGTLVEIVPVPEGGGEGLRIVLTLAVVAAAVATGGLAVPLLGAVGASVLGAGISVGGMMAVNALVPPPMPAAQKQASQTYSISPAQNSARLREPVKKILGRHRVTLDLAAPWYTEQRGDDQYLHGLLDVGLAPLLVTDLKLGEPPFDQYDQLDHEVLDGIDGGVVQSSRLYPGDVVQDGVSADLTKQYGEVVRPTRDETDQWSVDIAFPQGLQHGHGDGGIEKQTVTFSVRHRTSAADGDPAGAWSSPVQYQIEAESNIPIRRCLPPGGPGDFPARGKYDVGITRLTDDHDNGRILDATTWESLRSINGDAPVTLPGVVRLAIRIRASKQLNGQPPAVNCVATSVCPAWDSVSRSWVTDAVNGTRNPAALFREVLQGPGQPLPWDDDQLDLAALEAWSEWCDAKGWTCDYVVDTDVATLDLQKIVAGTGRASPMQPDGIWSVAVDGPKAAPVQLLTPRNGSNSRWRRIYTEIPHALRVVFVDATQGYKVGAERTVYDDGHDETNATKYLDWQLPGVTDPDLVHRHGRKHLAEMRLRPETWERDVGWEGLVCTRGDWVKASDDTIESGYVSARISLVESAAGRATAITLDDAVVLDGATQVGVAVRLSDGSLWTAPLAPFAGERHRLALETPVDLAAAGPAPGDLAVVGVRGSETDDLLVIDIRRGPDHTATVTAVPLAPAVHTAEDGPIPPWNPVLAPPAGSVAPVIWQIASDDAVLTRDADGAYHVSMVVAFYRDGAAPLEKYVAVKVEWQEVGTGHPTRGQEWPADVQTARVHDVILGETYEVRACYRLRPDLVAKGHPAYGPWSGTKTHFLDGPQLPPPDVGAPYLAGDRVVWSYPDPPPDFAGFAVRVATTAGQSWDAGQSLTDGLYPTAYVLLAEIPVSAAELLVRAEDATGNLSAGTARISVVGVPRPKVVTISTEDFAAEGFPGVVTGGEVSGGVLQAADTAVWLDPQTGAWLAPPADPWLASSFAAFEYVFTYAIPANVLPNDSLSLEVVYEGEIFVAFRSTSDALIIYDPDSPIPAGAQLLPPGWVPYGALLKDGGNGAALRPWRDGLRPTPGDALELTIFGRGGGARPRITALAMHLQSPLFTAVFGDQPIAQGGQQVRLPAGYRIVDWIHVTLHQPSPAFLAGPLDKDAPGGPTIIAYDQTQNPVAAVAEVTVGYA
jgi:hypothetical protein